MDAVDIRRDANFGIIFFDRPAFYKNVNKISSQSKQEFRRTEGSGKIKLKEEAPKPKLAKKFDFGSDAASYISFLTFIKSWVFFAPMALCQAIYGVVRFLVEMECINVGQHKLPDVDLNRLGAELILNTSLALDVAEILEDPDTHERVRGKKRIGIQLLHRISFTINLLN